MQQCSYWGTKAREKAISATWMKEKQQWVSSKDMGLDYHSTWYNFDLMCHKMMHSWQLPLYCSTLEKSTLTVSSPHALRHTNKRPAIRRAICQDHLDQPPTCWAQSWDKMDLGALSLFVFPKQNVNNTRCPGEWLKLNTSPLSVCLASDPLWCHVVPLKLWKDLGPLSPVCSTAVMQPPMMNYTPPV